MDTGGSKVTLANMFILINNGSFHRCYNVIVFNVILTKVLIFLSRVHVLNWFSVGVKYFLCNR